MVNHTAVAARVAAGVAVTAGALHGLRILHRMQLHRQKRAAEYDAAGVDRRDKDEALNEDIETPKRNAELRYMGKLYERASRLADEKKYEELNGNKYQQEYPHFLYACIYESKNGEKLGQPHITKPYSEKMKQVFKEHTDETCPTHESTQLREMRDILRREVCEPCQYNQRVRDCYKNDDITTNDYAQNKIAGFWLDNCP